jgi:hypothetical protein
MAGITYHPGLESHVLTYDRPFPEITEQPGVPIQAELTEAVGPVLAQFHNRFTGKGEDVVPLIVAFGAEEEDFRGVIEHPDEIIAKADYWNGERGIYGGIGVYALGAYIEPVLETAEFAHTDQKMTVHGPDETYDTPHYQFGICGGPGFMLRRWGAETPEGLEQLSIGLSASLGALTVGKEFAEMDLSAGQREHMHWLGVILKGKFLGERAPKSRWDSRDPEPSQLEQYREELVGGMPDSQSEELLPAVFALAQRVAELRRPVQHRIGENYALTDARGRVLEGQTVQ